MPPWKGVQFRMKITSRLALLLALVVAGAAMAGCSIFGITLEGAAPARRTPTRTAYATRTPRPALSPMPTWTPAPAQRALQTATMPAQRATSPAATQRTPQPGTQAAPPTATQATPQQAQRPTQAPAVATPKPTSTPSLLTSVDEITNAVNAGLHGIPFRITISEQEIGDAISLYLQSTPDVAFSDLQVSLVPGQALVTRQGARPRFQPRIQGCHNSGRRRRQAAVESAQARFVGRADPGICQVTDHPDGRAERRPASTQRSAGDGGKRGHPAGRGNRDREAELSGRLARHGRSAHGQRSTDSQPWRR